MQRPRFRVRTLMLVVGAVAIALGFGISSFRRRQIFRLKAADYAMRESFAGPTMGSFDHETTMRAVAGIEGLSRTDDKWAAIFAADRKRVEYYAAMKRKYEHAASYPWMPVAPDPPRP